MTAAQFKQARIALGLDSQGRAAEFLHVSIRTVHGYENGAPIPEAVAMLLRVMIAKGVSPSDAKAVRP